MADTAASTGSEALADETPTQRQARLRRQKRQQKMEEQGEDRLNRIKALNGGVAPPKEVLGGPAADGPKAATVADDPEEVDISQNTSGFGTPNLQQQQKPVDAAENPLAAAMLQMQQQEAQNQQQKSKEGGSEDDPMMRMMQQVMGAMGGQNTGGDPNAPPPELPPMMKAMLGGGAAAGAKQDSAPPATSSAYLWRIVHALFAFALAAYIALTSTFNGSALSRSQSVYHPTSSPSDYDYGISKNLFTIFVTFELLLQSARYFAEKGQLQGNGMIAKVANSGMVPEPYAGYVRIAGRYVGIVQTVVADAMCVVFVFGALAWWGGEAHA